MAHQIDYRIAGHDMQAVILTLDEGETVRAEAGALMYMDGNMDMETSTGGGLIKGLLRKLSGENFWVTTFTAKKKRGEVAFAAPYPGHIVPVDLAETGPVLCQRDSYLCSAYGIDVSVAFTKRLGAGFFGGEGFVLQKLKGDDGLAFIHAGGTVVVRDLGPKEHIKVDTGCLVAFQESVDYSITLAKGIKSMIFGGEGLFLAKLTGPGRVWIQTLPFARLADRVIGAMKEMTDENKEDEE